MSAVGVVGGVVQYGTDANSLESVHGKSVIVPVNKTTHDVIAEVRDRWVIKNPEINDGFRILFGLLGTVSPDVLNVLYANETPWISSAESAKQMCLSVGRKLFWLVLNLRITFAFKDKGRGFRTGDPSIRKAEFPVIGASSYLALLNYWFGWNHNTVGVKPKTRVSGAREDPIAILRFVVYFRKFYELSGGNVDESDLIELSNEAKRLNYYNYKMMIPFAFGTTKGADTTFFTHVGGDDKYYLRDLYEEIMRARKVDSSEYTYSKLYDKKCEDLITELVVNHFKYPLLENVFMSYIYTSFAGDPFGDGENGRATLITKWVAQQMLWAWGGVTDDFDSEVLSNNMPGTQRITANKLMFYLYRKVLYWNGQGDSPKKTIPALWNSLCHVPHREDMVLWLREICPDVFSGNIPPPLDIANWKSNLPLYRLVLLSYAHPAFAAQAINAIYDAVPQQTADGILQVIKQGWADIKKDIATLNKQGSPIPLLGNSPHTIWIRKFNVSKDVADSDYYRLRVFDSGSCTIDLGLDDCGYKTEGKWGCVCNQFTLEDANLELQQTAQHIKLEYLKLIQKVKDLEDEKNKVLAAMALKVDYVTNEEGKQVSCIKAYEDVANELKAVKNLISATKLSLVDAEKREQDRIKDLQACEADKQICEARQQGCDDCKVLLAELETQLGAKGQELKKQFSELVEFRDKVYSKTQSKPGTAADDVLKAIDSICNTAQVQGQPKSKRQTKMDAKCAEAIDLKAQIVKELGTVQDTNTAILSAVKALNMNVGRLDTENVELQSRLLDITKEKMEALEKAKTAEESATKTAQEVQACEDQNKQLAERAQKDLEAKEQELAALQAQLDAINKAKPTTADEEKARQDKVNRLMSELATRLRLTACTKNLEKLKTEIEALKKSHAAEIAALETKLNQECEDKMKQLKTQQDLDAAVASTNATKQAEIDALNQKHAAELIALNQKSSDELKALTQKDAAEIAKLNAEITKLNAELQQAGSASTAMSADAKKIAAEISELKAQVAELQTKLASCEASKAVCDAELKVKTASVGALSKDNTDLKAEVEALKLINETNKDAVAKMTAAQAQLQVKQMEHDKCIQELKDLQAKYDALEAEAQKLRSDAQRMIQELSLCATGITPPRLQTAAPPVVVPSGAMETGMPAALVTRYEVGSRPEKINQETVDMMALGTSCNADAANTKPAGCFETANVQCATADQVIRGVCNYGTIAVPLDLDTVSMTYSVLDPGSKVKLQLQSALFKFNRASELLINGSTIVLDRHLFPLAKLYNHESIIATDVAGFLKVPNSQYSKYIDTRANVVARTLFETLYGRDHALKDAEEAKYIGVEFDQTGPTAPRVMYKVDVGPFSGMYKVPKGEVVHPAKVHVHPKYHSINPIEFRNSGGFYIVPGAVANLSAMESGRRLLMQAARHLINAALTYVGIAYDRKLVKIPSTQIPSGAFSMLPRADVDAVLALAVLYPRTNEKKYMPDFNMDIGDFEKDDIGSGVSRARAAVCEVLANYNVESMFTGDISLAAKTKPENRETMLSEAAKRVAEIAMLAETMNT